MLNSMGRGGLGNASVITEDGMKIEDPLGRMSSCELPDYSTLGLYHGPTRQRREANYVKWGKKIIGAYCGFPHWTENDFIQEVQFASSSEFFENYFQGNSGPSVIAFFDDDRLRVARDVVGGRPVYTSESHEYVAFASEKKALWAVGLRDIIAIPPGHHALIGKEGIFISHGGEIRLSSSPVSSKDEAVDLLHSSLQRGASRFLSADKVGLLFSGGLDSSVVASILLGTGVKVLGCVAGLSGSYDISVARKNAGLLGLDLETYEVSPSGIKEHLPKLVRAIEGYGHIDVSVGLPLMLAAARLGERRTEICATGQGCDELFGGYSRYLTVLRAEGYGGLDDALRRDVTGLHVGLERDSKVLATEGVEMWSPYIERCVVEVGLSIAPELKVWGSDDMLRKRIVRELGERIGLPSEILALKKKAAQYGSGFHKELRRQNLYVTCEKLYEYVLDTQ